MMDIDDLGAKGEQRFGELCADAGLFCNKADRDRAGWDFVVNFRDVGTGRLDERQGAHSCYVQVKTVLATTAAARLKLNMAERLAKEGAFNRWMQHTEDCVSSRSVANETATPDLLQRDAEGADVGALAQGRIAAENCPAF
ncbi:hypothetical protein [Paraburkholderia caledonica]|uniref:hypothetical protein n=1 Tax=Paraburkholderia caledonica TaxID=134536 RepID=UPI00126039EF|nr:hypothetical protein [Paraburkholderia caledonica]